MKKPRTVMCENKEYFILCVFDDGYLHLIEKKHCKVTSKYIEYGVEKGHRLVHYTKMDEVI